MSESEKKSSRRSFLARSSVAAAGAALIGSAATAPAAEPNGSEGTIRRFELGTVTFNLGRDMDLDTLIQTCERTGFRAVELRTTHRHGVEPSLSAEERKAVRARFARSDIALFGLGTACDFHSPNRDRVQANIESTQRFVELAADVGAIGVKVRPNGLPEGVPVETTLEQIAASLATVGEHAARYGVEIWLEVHGPGTSHPPHIRTIMDLCEHPAVGVTWNGNNSDVKDGSVRPYFELLAPFIRCVHMRDLYINYPYRELFGLLRSVGYDRYTLAEVGQSSDPERVMRYYRALWEELSRPG
jgi:sugar phosphate isomerase/epimerase